MCRLVLNRLKENRKIASATHNIYAYRVRLATGVMAQDCEDDGETKAGSRMLHLMAVSRASCAIYEKRIFDTDLHM